MNKRVGRKVGDTLIEVTLAIGIFSMVAIAVVAVMNGGTSSAQTALETTLAREEIDTQAEALRFIQSAYIADKNSGSEGAYTRLWEAIGNLVLSSYSDTLSSTPDKCSDLYSGTYYENNAFIINPKMLNSYEKNYNEATSAYQKTNQLNKVLITSSSNKLTQTTTYPRLVYGTASLNDSANSLYLDTSGNTYNNLYGAQGIYIIAVKDNSSTNIIKDDNTAESDSAFYDFYIRTCWYGNDGETPSTISTVVRLYDPLTASDIAAVDNRPVTLRYDANAPDASSNIASQVIPLGGSVPISSEEPVRDGFVFAGWNTRSDGSGRDYNAGDSFTATAASNKFVTLFAKWKVPNRIITVRFDSGISQVSFYSSADGTRRVNINGGTISLKDETQYKITATARTYNGFGFGGWSVNTGGVLTSRSDNPSYLTIAGDNVTLTVSSQDNRIFMQDFSVDECRQKASSETYRVYDRRDGQGYGVRYASGRCWMTDDLEIFTTNGQNSGVILSTDSNFSNVSSWKLNASTSASYTEAYSSAGWYNFCAATANNGNGCTMYNYYYGDNDICPANWRMSTYPEIAQVRSNRDVFQLSGSYENWDWWTTTSLGSCWDDGSNIQCALRRSGDDFIFPGYGCSGSYYTGNYRRYQNRVRCLHK